MKITFNLSTFIAFFLGFIIGIIFLVLCYVIYALILLKKKKNNIDKVNKSINEETIKNIIKIKQNQFLLLRKTNPIFQSLKDTVLELINEIAKIYYPKSKHPIAELSINEIMLLDKYLLDKINELLSKKGFKILKNIKISTILTIADMNTNFQKNKVIKYSKKLHLPAIVKTINLGFNVLNPFYWFKKLVISPSINLIIKKMFLIIISIVGEETYQIYSKKLFITDEEELKLLDDSLEDIEKDKISV